MKKQWFKRIISICMIFAISATTFHVIPYIFASQDTDITLETAPEKDFTFWTFSDLGIADATSNAVVNWYTPKPPMEGSLDKSVFNGKISFPAGVTNFGNYYFGGAQKFYAFIVMANGTDGLRLYYNCKATGHFHNQTGDTGKTSLANNQIATFDSTTAKTTLRGNADLQFSLSVEYVEDYGDTVDVQVGVFFDGKLYNNEHYIVKDIPKSELARNVSFNVANSATYTIASHRPVFESVLLKTSPEKDFDFWTFSDLEIADTTSNAALNWNSPKPAMEGSLDKSVFNGKICFPSGVTNFGNYYFGGAQKWYGFIVMANGADGLKLYYNCKATGHFHNQTGDTGKTAQANTQIATFDSATAGTTLRGNADLQFSLSVEYVADKGDTVDVQVGVFFDGKLYNSEYYIVKDIPKSEMARNVGFYVLNSATYTIASHRPVFEDILLKTSPEKDFDFWTFSDLGITDTTSNAALNWNPPKPAMEGSLDKSVFNGKICFPSGVTNFGNYYFGGAQKWYGFIVMANGADGLKLYYNCKATGHFHNQTGDTGKTAQANTQIATFDSATAGTTLRGNADLQFSLSVEYVADKGDTVDVQVGVFFDGKLYNNEYYIVKDIPKSEMARNVGFYVLNSATYTIASIQPEKEEILLENAPEKEFTPWTFADLRITDRTSGEMLNWDPKQPAAGDTLDKTVFQGKIAFPADVTNFGNYYFGSSIKWYGFMFQANGTDGLKLYYNSAATGHFHNQTGDTGSASTSGTQIALLDPKTAKTTLRGNADLELSLSVEYVEDKGDTVDLKVGVFFDGKLYNSEYYTVKDVAKADLSRNLGFYAPTAAVYTIASVGKTCRQEQAPADRINITLRDAGILDVSDSSFSGKFDLDTLDGTLFSAMIRYTADGSRLHLGFEDPDYTFGGISFRLSGGKLVISNEYANYDYTGAGILQNMPFTLVSLSPTVAGVGESFQDTEFLLQVSIDFIDNDEDGNRNDIQLGVFIDGMLYNNMYFILKDDAEYLGTRINFNSGKVASCVSYRYEGHYTELTAKDFGLHGKAISSASCTAVYDDQSFDETAVTMMLQFPKGDGNRIIFGGESSGVCFETKSNGEIAVSYIAPDKTVQEMGVIRAKGANLSQIVGKKLEWRFAFRVTPVDEGRAYLKLGVYINGQLYGGKPFTLADVETAALERAIHVSVAAGICTISDVSYEELTTNDFSIPNVAVTELAEGKTYRTENYCDLESLDNTAFSAVCRFPKDGEGRFTLGSPFWFGVLFASTKDGRIQVAMCNSDKTVKNFVYLDAATAGVGSFTDKDFTVRLTFDILTTAEGKGDLLLGIYINGQLYNGQHYYLRNISPEVLTRNLQVYVTNAPFSMKTAKQSIDLSVYGFTNAGWKKELGLG